MNPKCKKFRVTHECSTLSMSTDLENKIQSLMTLGGFVKFEVSYHENTERHPNNCYLLAFTRDDQEIDSTSTSRICVQNLFVICEYLIFKEFYGSRRLGIGGTLTITKEI